MKNRFLPHGSARLGSGVKGEIGSGELFLPHDSARLGSGKEGKREVENGEGPIVGTTDLRGKTFRGNRKGTNKDLKCSK